MTICKIKNMSSIDDQSSIEDEGTLDTRISWLGGWEAGAVGGDGVIVRIKCHGYVTV